MAKIIATRRFTALGPLRLAEFDFEDFAVAAEVHTASTRPPPIVRLRRGSGRLASECKSISH